MALIFEERPVDSAFVERIWRSRSEGKGSFVSMAVSHWAMVVTRHEGRISLTVRGPETKASPAHYPADGDWVGIHFKLGTYMPYLPASSLVDGEVTLPGAAARAFWLSGSAWEFPDFENADVFIDRLVRHGLLSREPVVEAAVLGQLPDVSLRSSQRRFLQATGLSQSAARQIERARSATILLQEGVSILDTVEQAGYSDQPHLTRSLRRLIGQTPAQVIGKRTRDQLSYLFKTDTFSQAIMNSFDG